jgi:hypothetical protein
MGMSLRERVRLRNRQPPADDLKAPRRAKPRPAAVGPSQTLFEGSGILIASGENSDAGGGDDILAIEDSFDLPAYATQAAVLLNGWSLEYLEDDHHVWAFGTWIEDSRIENGALKWQANGWLADDGQDDAFEWHYYFLVIAWDGSVIRARADHTDVVDTANSKLSTLYPIVASRAQSHVGGLTPRRTVVLPRGFQFRWGGLDDHHLLHAAYNVSASENSGVAEDGQLRVGADASWDTYAILQDNSYEHFVFSQFNSTLSGSGVNVIQPPFATLPTRIELDIGSPTGGEVTQEKVIDGVPFEFATPMLTGWDLRYDFDDEHVQKMGVWLSDIEYEQPTPRSSGTLRYKLTSVLRDKDADPNYAFNSNVHILGFSSRPVFQ